MDFSRKSVLVTGSTSGIGRAVAELFARLGADVIVSGRNADAGQEVVDGIHAAGGTARFVQADLSHADDVARLAAEAGAVDVLVNNAAAQPAGSTADTTVDGVRDIFAVNVIAPFVLVGQIAPKMGARGEGAIVNTSSFAAGHGIPFLPAYGASKAGIDVLTKTWSIEYGPLGVRVNAIAPGAVRTPPAVAMGDMFEQMANATPLGRAAAPEEIAAVIAFLASEDASYITGAVIPVDAGMSAS